MMSNYCNPTNLHQANTFFSPRRPKFQCFNWQLSLVGMFACLLMCVLINDLHSLIAFLIFLILMGFLALRGLPHTAQWGYVSQAVIFHQVRKYLLLLDMRKQNVRPLIYLLYSNFFLLIIYLFSNSNYL